MFLAQRIVFIQPCIAVAKQLCITAVGYSTIEWWESGVEQGGFAQHFEEQMQ
jgi:hypothetical protein